MAKKDRKKRHNRALTESDNFESLEELADAVSYVNESVETEVVDSSTDPEEVDGNVFNSEDDPEYVAPRLAVGERMKRTQYAIVADPKRLINCTSNAALFAVGSELSRRGYVVAFTIGNATRIDLLCSAPDGRTFKVQVKGISNKAGFYAQESFFTARPQSDLFLVIVYVPKIGDESPCRFFVLSHRDAIRENKKMKGPDYGLNWGSVVPYKDNWRGLPAIRS